MTGSGKTEVYMALIEEGLKRGKQSIVLVPEISLTPQTLRRFEQRFGSRVAIFIVLYQMAKDMMNIAG